MKKICYFSTMYLPGFGGVERYTHGIAKKLQEKNVEVTIVTSDNYIEDEFRQEDGLKIYRTPCFPLMNGRLPVVKMNKKMKSILKKLKECKFDLVIINTRFYPFSVVGARFAKKNNIPCIVIEHGSAHLSFNNTILDIVENIYEHTITRVMKHYVSNYYGVSEKSNEWLKHFHINAKGVLYNAVEMKQIQDEIDQSDLRIREKFDLNQDNILITYAGRLITRKGILETNEAVKKLSEKYPNIRFIVAGDGDELREKLQNEKSRNTILLGQLEHKDVLALMNQSDIFILASETEGMPTGVIEAMACQCVVVTTTMAGGAVEIINDSKYGVLMEDNDCNTIVSTLEQLILDENYREKAAEYAYSRINDNFTWDVVSDKIIEMI